MMKKTTVKSIVIWGVYVAIFSLFGFTFLGYPKIWTVELTLMPILVIIITMHLGLKGLVFGFIFFGLSSFLSAWTIASPLALIIISKYSVSSLFIIAFISRILLGILVGIGYFLLRNTPFFVKFIFVIFATLIGNTFLFLGALTIFNVSEVLLGKTISLGVWLTLVVPNIILEWVVLPIICFSLSPLIIYLKKSVNSKYAW